MKILRLLGGLLMLGCSDVPEAPGMGGGDDDASTAADAMGDGDDAARGDGDSDEGDAGDGDGDVEPPTPCTSAAGEDSDQDGFKAGAADCNDCDPNVNVAAYDVVGNQVDDDCSGTADDEPAGCDVGLANSSESAGDAAKALGLCRAQSGNAWGLVSSKWVMPNGNALSMPYAICGDGKARPPDLLAHGLLETYGPNNKPSDGKRMVALSSGLAQAGYVEIGQEAQPAYGKSPDGVIQCIRSEPPPGFPKTAKNCPNVGSTSTIEDGVALELKIKVPSNAVSVDFDFFFVSTEFPLEVCHGKNDHFVALLYSSHPGVPSDHNISFDKDGNVVSVDNAFLEVCDPVTLDGRTFTCPRGKMLLEGTDVLVESTVPGGQQTILNGGATGWLVTRAPVVPGETITLRFAIWDADDPVLDSTVLLDHLRWTTKTTKAQPSKPPEEPETEFILF